jgi:hypothetical protein
LQTSCDAYDELQSHHVINGMHGCNQAKGITHEKQRIQGKRQCLSGTHAATVPAAGAATHRQLQSELGTEGP